MPTLDYPRADECTPGDGSRVMQRPPLQDKRIGLWTAGVEFAVTIILPTWGGYWLDERWGTKPWLVVCGAVLGFAVATLQLVKLVGSSTKQQQTNKSDSGT